MPAGGGVSLSPIPGPKRTYCKSHQFSNKDCMLPVLLTNPRKNMQKDCTNPLHMKEMRRPRESARKKMKIRHDTTLTMP